MHEEGARGADDLLEQVQATARRHRMWNRGDCIVVGVSGGPDSVALLHVLWRLREAESLSLVAAHLHHGLRGREADEDAEFVRSLAAAWSIPVVVRREDVGEWARQRRLSLQAAGREARYAFFRAVAREAGAQRIALGHHADDQAETVLLRLLRGAGTRGLAGIPPVRGWIIRPLIDCRREDILAYCACHGLPYRTDPSNADRRFLRNRVRHELIPELERRYNPRLREVLARTAAILREENDFLEQHTRELYRALAREEGDPGGDPVEGHAVEVVLPGPALLSLHPALQHRLILHALSRLRLPGQALARRLSTQLIAQLEGEGQGSCLMLPGGLTARVEDGHLRISRGRPRPEGEAGFEVAVRVPGVYRLAGGRWTVRLWKEPMRDHVRHRLAAIGLGEGEGAAAEGEAEAASLGQDERETPAAKWFLHPGEGIPSEGVWEAVMDWNRLRPPLKLRSRRPGDRFRPLGLGGSKKLQDFFVDSKVPGEERARVPLLVDEEGIACVVGYRIDERVRVGADTSDVLILWAYRQPDGPGDEAGTENCEDPGEDHDFDDMDDPGESPPFPSGW